MHYTLIGKIVRGLTYQIDKSLSVEGVSADAKATGEAINAVKKIADDHIANSKNPHKVTKAQVGLNNVDNTADKDKPVSTLQAEAIAQAMEAAEFAQIAADNAQAHAEHAYIAADIAKMTADKAQESADDAVTKSMISNSFTETKEGKVADARTVNQLSSFIGNSRIYSGMVEGLTFKVKTEWKEHFFLYFDRYGNAGIILKGRDSSTYVKIAGGDLTLSYVDDYTVKITNPAGCSHAYVILISGLPLEITNVTPHR